MMRRNMSAFEKNEMHAVLKVLNQRKVSTY